MPKPSFFPRRFAVYNPGFVPCLLPPIRVNKQSNRSFQAKQSQGACKKSSAAPLCCWNQPIMDKVLAFSILSASPADINPGADATGGSWARLSWRGMKLQDAQTGQQGTSEAEQQQLCKGKSQSQLPPRRPRFAPEFDGIDCFETIVWR